MEMQRHWLARYGGGGTKQGVTEFHEIGTVKCEEMFSQTIAKFSMN